MPKLTLHGWTARPWRCWLHTMPPRVVLAPGDGFPKRKKGAGSASIGAACWTARVRRPAIWRCSMKPPSAPSPSPGSRETRSPCRSAASARGRNPLGSSCRWQVRYRSPCPEPPPSHLRQRNFRSRPCSLPNRCRASRTRRSARIPDHDRFRRTVIPPLRSIRRSGPTHPRRAGHRRWQIFLGTFASIKITLVPHVDRDAAWSPEGTPIEPLFSTSKYSLVQTCPSAPSEYSFTASTDSPSQMQTPLEPSFTGRQW